MAEFLFTDPSGSQYRVTAPEGATQDQAFAMLQGQPATQPAQAVPSMLDQLKRQLGLTARAGATGITSTLGAGADFIKGAAELARGNTQFPKSELPSNQIQQFMTQLGLPQPQTTGENIANVGASMLAGGMDPAIIAAQKAAQVATPNVGPSALNQTRQELRAADYKLPPTEAGGGMMTRGGESLAGKGIVAQDAAAQNQQVTQRLAAKALGLPIDEAQNITGETLKNQAQQLIREGYDPIRNIAEVNVGSSYRNDLNAIKNDLGGSNSFPLAQRNEVNNLVNKYLYSGGQQANGMPRYVQSYTGEDALKEVKLLRQEASAEFKPGGDPLLGEAMRRIGTALEDNIETSLRNTGSDLVSAFRDARIGLAKNFAVERMLTDPSTGVVSTQKAFAISKNTPLTDELATIAKAGSPLFSKATGVPTGGNPSTITPWDYTRGVVGGALGLANHPVVGAAIAAYPLARFGARSAVLSNAVQNAMARGLTPPPSMFGDAAARVAAGMPAQLLPLFSQGQQ